MTAAQETDRGPARLGAAQDHPDIILYDGVCGLCNRLVRFVLARDREAHFRFAWLQGPVARELLARHGRDVGDGDSVYALVSDADGNQHLLEKSAAVIEILRRLGGFWSASALLRFVPAAVLDAGYDLVARNRYRIFGRSETCAIPEPRWRDRFLD